jgi:phage terminase large subunit-like protein
MTAVVSTLAPRARRRMEPPAPPHPVTQYAIDVLAGRVVVGDYVRRAAERHLADLSSGQARGLWFDEAAATKVVEFFALLRHYKGDLGKADGGKGAFVELEAWQIFVVGCLFGWKRADGLRRFRTLYLEVAKKNGKTLLGAGLMLLLAFFDNEPGAECYSLATKEDQAKLSWNDGAQFVAKNASIKQFVRRLGKRLVNEATASFWGPLGRDSDTGDQGINPHGALVDELHVLVDPDAIDNVETAMASRSQPILAYITTAGVKRESVWADTRKDAVAVLEGRATDDAMLVLIYTLDEGDDPFDEAVWPKANPNLDVSVRRDSLREQAEKAKRMPSKLAPFLRFRMNVPTGVSTKAIDIDEWDLCSGLEEGEDYHAWETRLFGTGAEVSDETPQIVRVGYGGLDLASVRDLTAFLFVSRDDEGYYDILCRFWCPEDGIEHRSKVDGVPYADWVRDGYLVATPGNVTDYDFVEEEVDELAGIHEINETGFDRWNATQLATNLGNRGAKLIAIPQTSAGLAPGWREIEKAILERKLRHGGHPILRWMAGNVEVETDAAGNQKPSKARSAERIDGMVSLDMAVGRWMVHAEVEQAEPWVIIR